MKNMAARQEAVSVYTKKVGKVRNKKYLHAIPIIAFFVLWEVITRLNINFSIVNPVFFHRLHLYF